MSEEITIKTLQEWGGTYDEIHDVLYQAHENNRKKGIVYQSSLLSGDELRKKIGDGITYVAIKDDRVVGTGSVSMRVGKYWYDKGLTVAHFCFDAVLTDYQGQGIMKQIDAVKYAYAASRGAQIVRSGTSEKNIIQRERYKRDGFTPVDYLVSRGNNFYSVMYAKWLDDSVSQNKLKCWLHMWRSRIRVRIMNDLNGSTGFLAKLKNRLGKTIIYRFCFHKKMKSLMLARGCQNFYENASTKTRIRMKWSYILFDVPYKDYFQCRCDLLPFFKIREIIPLKAQRALYEKFNSAEAHEILCDKFSSYEFFKPFYRREIEIIRDGNDVDAYLKFCEKHSKFLLKPLRLNCGQGIQIVERSKSVPSFEELLVSYPESVLLEELIDPAESLAQFHPASVNTLRINTVNYGDSIEVKWPCLRVGRGGSIVDNAGAGGIFGAIDPLTGKIISASDEFHHTFDVHPDTGIPFAGFEVPLWNEACEMAKQLAGMIPHCHFVGWDFALTDEGWVLVEGNWGPLIIWQIAVGKGIRKDFQQMCARLNNK